MPLKKRVPLILDCDTGEDDALAILVAVANKLPLKYVVTSYGNTTISNATKNSSRLLSLSGASRVKVLQGSEKPLQVHPIEKKFTAGDFVGKNGLCNVILSPSKFKNVIKPEPDNFPQILAGILQHEGSIEYIITGPCTNFARVCELLGKDIKKYVKKLYIMGGAIETAGNSGPKDPKTKKQLAEFNFYGDAFSANIVLGSGIPTYLVTWDITSTVTIPFVQIKKFLVRTPVARFTKKLMTNFFTYYGLSHDRNFELNDPLTILAQMGYGKYKKKMIRVITDKKQFGRSVEDKNGSPIYYFHLTEAEKLEAAKKILSALGVKFASLSLKQHNAK